MCPSLAHSTQLPAADTFLKTGIAHFDKFIRGQRPGDCNGLLGVIGAGKTTQLIDLSVSNARNFYRMAAETGSRPKLSVLMGYDEPESKLKKRIWANAACIPHCKLSQSPDWTQLTTQENLEPYEHHLPGQASDNGTVLSELERWDAARVWLNQTFRLLDMTGLQTAPCVGTGHVDEIVECLEQLSADTRSDIGAVQIDDSKLLCTRYMHAKNIDLDKLRHYLGRIGDELGRRVAEHFSCTVWVTHQVAADKANRSPTTLVHHSEAREFRSFAENMPVCGCLGVPDSSTGCRLLNWSKVRYCDSKSQAAPVLKIDGDFCRLIDVSHRYVPDPLSHSFIDLDARQQVEGPLVSHP